MKIFRIGFLVAALALSALGAVTAQQTTGACVVNPGTYTAGSGTIYYPVCDASGNLKTVTTGGGGGGGGGTLTAPYSFTSGQAAVAASFIGLTYYNLLTSKVDALNGSNGALFIQGIAGGVAVPISGAPTPIPTPAGGIYPISGAPTPIPTPAGGVYPISGAPTPIPTPIGGVYPISGAPTPIPTPAGGIYPVSASTTLPVAIAGTVAISGAPTPIPTPAGGVYPVSVATTLAVQGIAGGVPQPVSGTVTISNTLPTPIPTPAGGTYPVSGAVSVSNFPATQPVSGTLTVNTPAPIRTTAAGVSDTAGVPIQGVTGGIAVPISGAPTPIPTPAGGIYPISGAPTPIPTPAGGIYPISGAPTPIPTPAGGVYPISGAPTPIPTPAGGIYPVSAMAVTGFGATRFALATITTNAVTNICASACTAYDISAINTTAATCFIQEFNTAAASVTLGTTAPVRILLVPATTGFVADTIPPTIGAKFSTAWSFATTTTPTGSTACGATVYVQADYV